MSLGTVSPSGTLVQHERNKPSMSTIVGYGLAKPATKRELTALEKLRVELRAIGTESEREQQNVESKLTPRPFYADVKANVYSVLGSPDDLSEDPWNATIGVLTHGRKDTRLEHFQVDRTPSDCELSSRVGVFIECLKSNRTIRQFWTDSSNLSSVMKLMFSTAASEFWSNRLKFDPLVSSSQVYITREKNESKAKFSKRYRQFMSLRVNRYHNLLAKVLEDTFTHKHRREEALSLVHLIRTTVKELPSDSQLGKDIRSVPKMIPTVDMLRRLGKLPDLSIKEFNSMFYQSEWNIIKSSRLYKEEEALKKLLKEAISFDKVEGFLDTLTKMRESIAEDALSSVIVKVKKKRLMYASWWKSNQSRDLPMNPLREAHRHTDEENVKDTFFPFTILIADHTPLAEEGLTRIHYDASLKSWYWDDHPGSNGVDPSDLNRAGHELISYLNV